ncbi:prolipoprotein diacylglyceryl transferase [Candidatus Nitromaritima sp. SCGC AAA799-C22]|nr:prolipoprotein diacylglyceryl transferase [Candidatus Nitromaritima sp. SCGC AAA799-C22]
MHPVLVEFGFVKIFTYGLLVASGFLAAILLASSRGEKEGLDPQKILDLCFYLMVSALLGARLLYVIVEYKYFAAAPLEVFKFWKGGLVYYGGLILGVLVALWYLKRHALPVWKVADLLAPSIALGQGIGRWGCFFAGCCYGVKTDVPWAITFSDPRSLAPLGIPLHPTQIYLSLNALAIFAFLMWLSKRKTFDGQIFWTYGILYSIGRFIIEYFRGDDRGYAIEHILSTSQFVGIFILIVSITMLFSLRREKVGGAHVS